MNSKKEAYFCGNNKIELQNNFKKNISKLEKLKVDINILFVCSSNIQRSITAENYFSKRHPKISFKSAGTNLKNCKKNNTVGLSEELLDWSTITFVMEEKHKDIINNHTKKKYNKKIKVLQIPDLYQYYSNDLIEILNEKLEILEVS